MDGITLLESGTSRAHFALVKKLENANDAKEADLIVIEAVKQARLTLTGKSGAAASAEPTLSAQLLCILHCHNVYPHSRSAAGIKLDLGFALVPALTLLSIAKHAKGLQIAYSTIELLIGRTNDASSEDIAASSLLLFNTMRLHLGSSVNASRRSSRSQPGSSLQAARTYMALRSIVSGVPRGAEVVPAFHGPVSALMSHADQGIRSLAVRAMTVLQTYRIDEEDKGLARAVWEDSRKACLPAQTPTNGKPRSVSAGVVPESLLRALMDAALLAFREDVLSADEFVDVVLACCPVKSSSTWLQVNAMRTLRMSQVRPSTEKSLEVSRWALASIKSTNFNYPLLVEASTFAGQHVDLLQSDRQAAPFLQECWSQCVSHLQSHNSNRKVLALLMLRAMLTYGWTESDSILQLSEDDMTKLLSGLSESDPTLRLLTLRLLSKVQRTLLSAHLQALENSLSSLNDVMACEETTVRAVEVVGVLRETDDSSSESRWTQYAAQLCGLLQDKSAANEVLHPVVRMVADTINQVDDATGRAKTIDELLVRLKRPAEQLHATTTMLVPTLVCEALAPGKDPEVRGYHVKILTGMSALLSLTYAQSALQEAWIVAMIKLAALNAQTTVQSTLKQVTEFSKSCKSNSVKQRLEQFTYMARDERTEQLGTLLCPLSLIDTLDVVDDGMRRYFYAESQRFDTQGGGLARQVASSKPLRYEEYDTPVPSPSSSSPSTKSSANRQGAFQPKARPSSIRSQLLKDSMAAQQLEAEMRQSVAQLTLQDDAEGDRDQVERLI